MNFRKLVVSSFILVLIAAVPVPSASAQTKMTKEEWQKQITDYTGQRDCQGISRNHSICGTGSKSSSALINRFTFFSCY
jgi:hypothetical protein